MLCWTQTLCWSSSCSLKARSSSSALRSISLSAISLVLQPGPTPLKHKKNKCILLYITCSVNKFSFIHVYATEILDANTLFSGCYVNRTQMKHADFDCTYQKCDSIISGDAVICPFQWWLLYNLNKKSSYGFFPRLYGLLLNISLYWDSVSHKTKRTFVFLQVWVISSWEQFLKVKNGEPTSTGCYS